MNQSGDDPGDSRTAATAKKPSQSRKREAQSASGSDEVTANSRLLVQDTKRRKVETQSLSGNVGGAGRDMATPHRPDAFFTDLNMIPDLGLVNITPPRNTDANDNLENVVTSAAVQPNPGSHRKPIMISSEWVEHNDGWKPEFKLN